MNTSPPESPHCQLEGLYDGTAPRRLRDRLRQLALRMLSAAERRIRRLHDRLRTPRASPPPTPSAESRSSEPPATFAAGRGEPPEFAPGDLVEVLSAGEIRATLIPPGVCDGLWFMEGMERFCGQRLRVRTRVTLLFDETRRKMLRVKRPRYILEGAICDGKDAYDREGCDRSCFFFWSPRWLRGPIADAAGDPPPLRAP